MNIYLPEKKAKAAAQMIQKKTFKKERESSRPGEKSSPDFYFHEINSLGSEAPRSTRGEKSQGTSKLASLSARESFVSMLYSFVRSIACRSECVVVVVVGVILSLGIWVGQRTLVLLRRSQLVNNVSGFGRKDPI